MMRKATIAYLIFTVALLYIITPWFFEKKLLFNELLAATGFLLLLYKRFRIGNDPVSIGMVLLLSWCGIHAVVSLARMDSVYFYLRNMVIVYSMFAFFIGFFLLKYLGAFVNKIRLLLRAFIGLFILIPLPRTFFERFGVAMLFPALFKNAANKWIGLLLIALNIIYGISYDSFTSMLVAGFFLLLFISPGYRFFMQVAFLAVVGFAIVFIYLHPNLNMISDNWAFRTDRPIHRVMESHPLLDIDGNSTWRLVLWNQLLVDDFPKNIFGLGFGTPVLKYYPVEDYNKLHTLPYVLGGHNSYVYLFARLGIVYLVLTLYIYVAVFKEYFYYKAWYRSNNLLLVFWSFFTVTMIALFNPVLESPIYASAYWMLLGFTARAIYNRRNAAPAI
jgi:O-Antigen ligase